MFRASGSAGRKGKGLGTGRACVPECDIPRGNVASHAVTGKPEGQNPSTRTTTTTTTTTTMLMFDSQLMGEEVRKGEKTIDR